MALRAFWNEIKTMKVKDVPGYVRPMLTVNNMKNSVTKGLDNYNDKYIQTGSVDPILHVAFGGLAFSYLVALPEERRHLAHQKAEVERAKAERDAKKSGH